MSEPLTLTPSESIRVVAESPQSLEVEATYGPEGKAPPAHLHPRQAERFEVLEGSVRTRIAGSERTYEAGEEFEVPAEVPHQMWNPFAEPARVRWQTLPAGRTREWFEAIDRLHREDKVGRRGMPGLLAFAALLTEFDDVFRLAVKPQPLVRAALGLIAPLGRMRGYLPD